MIPWKLYKVRTYMITGTKKDKLVNIELVLTQKSKSLVEVFMSSVVEEEYEPAEQEDFYSNAKQIKVSQKVINKIKTTEKYLSQDVRTLE